MQAIHKTASNRFVVNAECEKAIDEQKIYDNATRLIPMSVLSFDDQKDVFDDYFSISSSDDLFKDTTESVLTSTIPISVFYKDNNIAIVFDHSIADGRSAIVFFESSDNVQA